MAALRRAWTEENAGGPIEDDGFDAAFAEWFEREHDQRRHLARRRRRPGRRDAQPAGVHPDAASRARPTPPAPRAGGATSPTCTSTAAARDAGVGARLLDAATSYADEQGFARLVLSPSERSVPFYERAGFATATSLMLRPGR